MTYIPFQMLCSHDLLAHPKCIKRVYIVSRHNLLDDLFH